ncbi:unnamed protein product [Euphydryas editha]|uniref:Reverse transcriptase domain-containing protein n=1 Tax=Euphydryas editha TaxID=104508 RepID=A0AAU9UCT8_EUPED|nr:unnamed protein product [Euphydryas editha]
MNFRKVTPDSIQYLKSVSLTVQARLYIKLTKLHRVAVQNIWFNQQCKHLNVIPNYINLKTNTHSRASNIALKKAQQVWLNEESRHWFTVRDNLKLHLKILYSELSFKLHNIEFDLLDQKARDLASIEVHNKFLSQQKKLKSLVNNSSQSALSNNNTTDNMTDAPNHQFYPRVKNLTDIIIPKNEMRLLDNGLKYNIPKNNTQKTLETLAVESELAVVINKKDNIIKNIVAHEIKTKAALQNSKSNSKQHNTNNNNNNNIIYKSLQKTLIDNDLIISKADKGNAVVILKRTDYQNKVNEVISGEEFSKLSSDPTNKYAAEVRLSVNKSKHIFPKNTSKQNVIQMNTNAPILYGLPKIHKDNIPIRPVVSYIGAPAYELAKELNKVIKSKTSFDPTYSLKNSIQLVNKIKDLTLPGHCKLISLDVDSLFTNVPVKETLNILTKLLKNNHTNANEITELIELTKLCMKQNYFKFNNQFYQQKEGLAMGSPLSPLMADIFMDDFENKHIVKNNNILYYYRYVDDIIICWTGTDRQLDIFVKNLNNIHPKIKFKSELEQNHSINFLDLTITRVNNKHQFGIFRKPTYTDTTIPASSCHPWQHKLAAFHSYVHRLLSIPLTKENYLKELNLIYHMAQANGYNNNIVNNIIKKQKSMRIKKDLYSTAPDKINKYKSSLTYFGTVSERIAKTLKAHDLHVAFRTNNTLKNICNGKDKVNNKQKSGIYKLECSDCKATYIGQTGRKFETRYKEHIAAVRNNQPQKSHFAKHLLDSGHKLSSDHSYKILHTCDKGLRLSMLEQLEIIKHNNNNQFKLLNEQVNVSSSPLLRLFEGDGGVRGVQGAGGNGRGNRCRGNKRSIRPRICHERH